MDDRLLYHGSRNEVLVGDRILYRGLLSYRAKAGTVIRIPSKTGRQLAAEGKEPDDWLIKLADGTVTGWLYSPEDMQTPKRVRFLARGDAGAAQLTCLEFEKAEAAEESSLRTEVLAMALAVLAGCAIVALAVVLF